MERHCSICGTKTFAPLAICTGCVGTNMLTTRVARYVGDDEGNNGPRGLGRSFVCAGRRCGRSSAPRRITRDE